MFLIINEDRTPSTSAVLTDEIKECVEAGVIDVYDLKCNPVRMLNENSNWVEVEAFVAYTE